jgi:hypothetical protein
MPHLFDRRAQTEQWRFAERQRRLLQVQLQSAYLQTPAVLLAQQHSDIAGRHLARKERLERLMITVGSIRLSTLRWR